MFLQRSWEPASDLVILLTQHKIGDWEQVDATLTGWPHDNPPYPDAGRSGVARALRTDRQTGIDGSPSDY
jgi:hypothetical protein